MLLLTADNLDSEACGAMAFAPLPYGCLTAPRQQTNKCTSKYNIADRMAQGKREVRQRIV
ncbi:hypothetical protein QUB60_23780 [Microcoleus sp. A2-C5]|uniref:hypothetical protein n=1 Tax=unclassified Microcoleus TaxID=2642155 RepID=UPI002FD0B489